MGAIIISNVGLNNSLTLEVKSIIYRVNTQGGKKYGKDSKNVRHE